jgi:hypothetical protein
VTDLGNMTSVECHKRDRLLGEYNDAVLGAFVASQALSKIADTTVLSDYRALIGRQGIAGAKASKARLVYEQHIIEHGCGYKNPA